MQGYGGLVPIAEAAARPVGMIECGPAAGVVGAQHLAGILGDKNVIAADMGGTTFKVAVIQDGRFEYAREPMVDRYHYIAPKIDLTSIGAGGGSIVDVDHRTRRPTVGPASAGARPGPICYGFGGDKPTLTDVAAILGYMDPDTFLGGTLRLDVESARKKFAEVIARPLGMDVDAAASGIYRVAVARIADLIRNVTVERGLDPREFALAVLRWQRRAVRCSLCPGSVDRSRGHSAYGCGSVRIRHGGGRCLARLFGGASDADAGRTEGCRRGAHGDGGARVGSARRRRF